MAKCGKQLVHCVRKLAKCGTLHENKPNLGINDCAEVETG